ncbi:hypothetical protein ACRRTK_002812 [Alexandromys fortis]
MLYSLIYSTGDKEFVVIHPTVMHIGRRKISKLPNIKKISLLIYLHSKTGHFILECFPI